VGVFNARRANMLYPHNNEGGRMLIGDVVCYDWDGDGTVDHLAICVSKCGADAYQRGRSGTLVDAHQNSRFHALWNFNYSGWVTPERTGRAHGYWKKMVITVLRPK